MMTSEWFEQGFLTEESMTLLPFGSSYPTTDTKVGELILSGYGHMGNLINIAKEVSSSSTSISTQSIVWMAYEKSE